MFKNIRKKTGRILMHAAEKLMTGRYEGAATGRRLGVWGAPLSGPNLELDGSIQTLRARSRDVIRNNPHASSAIESYVANMVGTGIVPRWRIDDALLKERIQSLWLAWTKEADTSGKMDFYGLQSLVARAVMESGEVLVRFHPRRLNERLQVPFQLQVIESDHLIMDGKETQNRNTIDMGVEFNKKGKRVAYHLHRTHPGERQLSVLESVRIPANDILHIYRVQRPGQIRGIPWMTNVLVRLHELDEYEDAESLRKKTAALFAAFVTRPIDDAASNIGSNKGYDINGVPIASIEPGAVHYLSSGESVEFSQPADVGNSYEVWLKQQLRSIAAGIGVTYEQLTGDLRGVNYSSIRAGLLEFRRRVESLQHQLMVVQFCQPVAEQWLDYAVASGAIDIPDYNQNRVKYLSIEWRPPAWDWVDPLKDVTANQLSVRCGFKSRAQIVADLGEDIETIDRQLEEDHQRAESFGLKLDSDPAQTNRSGTVQNVVPQTGGNTNE